MRRAAGTASIDEVVKAERLARHAKRELREFGFQQAPKLKKTLAEHLADRAAERAGKGAEAPAA